MDVLSEPFADLTARLAAGQSLSSGEIAALAGTPDLASLGAFGERARRVLVGDVVTFGRVCEMPAGEVPADLGHAGELRITGQPANAAEAIAWARRARRAADLPLTGFSIVDLFSLADGGASLTTLSRELHEAGLDGVAEVPVDAADSDDALIARVRAVQAGGLGIWRFGIDRAALDARMPLMSRVAVVHAATGAVRAFAPLPRLDSADAPSTGYDDVRTVALARAICRDVPVIQVDWRQYGPKLAQVAIAFGANDLDNVPATDDPALGPRRAAREELMRQIRAAGATPRERNGRFEPMREAGDAR